MTGEGSGRANQRLRTRTSIVEAARTLVRTGAPLTMSEVAQLALVSEVTAYRYFPDLPSLLREVIVGLWPTPDEALAPVAASQDPAERVAVAASVLLRGIVAYQGAVRTMIAATITRPVQAAERPTIRFELIDHALDPAALGPQALDADRLARLTQDLYVIVSAENLFCLTDRLGLTPEDAVARIVRIATVLVEEARAGR